MATRARPLSFAQERMWFLDQLAPGDPAHNLVVGYELLGELDVSALRQALKGVVRRHESLRTRFVVVDGEPRQEVQQGPAGRLETDDLSAWGQEEATEQEAQRRAEAEGRRGFDLARGHLLRARLLTLAADRHWLILTTHHIISDGWSLNVLWEDLQALYGAASRGQPSPLPELPMRYCDYAEWQRSRLTGDALTRQLDYWRGQLRDCPALEIPADYPRPRMRSHAGGVERFELSPELTSGLKRSSRREGVTLFVTLLGVFTILLQRWAVQSDLAVGTPVASRTPGQTDRLIGLFLNLLPLRVSLDGDPSVRELLGRVRAATLGAFRHQDVPFETLVQELRPRGSPFFHVTCGMQTVPAETTEMHGLQARRLVIELGTALFDLSLSAMESGDQLQVRLEYARDLFDGETIRRMAGHLTRLLEGIAEGPDQRVSELPMLVPPIGTGAPLPPPGGKKSKPARTPMELALGALWEELFGVQGVGATDNFFELGGHSLLAVQMRQRIRESFGVDVSIREIVARPTLHEMAASIAARSAQPLSSW